MHSPVLTDDAIAPLLESSDVPLHLRPFAEDTRVGQPTLAFAGGYVGRVTFEESVADGVRPWGLLAAVSHPSKSANVAGGVRVRLEKLEWQTIVESLARNAKGVILRPGQRTAGFCLELGMLRRNVSPSRMVVVFSG